MAKELVEMGWYLGINRIVTFKNAEDLRQVVLHTPLEHLLLETDSLPLLIPFRGNRMLRIGFRGMHFPGRAPGDGRK